MRILAIIPVLLVAGCGQSFDERYEETEKKLEAQAAEMDRQLHTDEPVSETAEERKPPAE
jgi:hypothetical protein